MELSPGLFRIFVRPRWFSKRYVEDIIKHSIIKDYSKVLDFGCGIGSNCKIFDSSKYIGVDCDDRRIEQAKKLYSGYEFTISESSILPIDDKSIDQILICSVLHHIESEEIRKCLKEFHRVLKYKGSILVIEPYLKPNSILTNSFMRYYDKGNYIRTEQDYFDIFNNDNYETKVIKKYRQLIFYNKLFFIAKPIW